MKRLQEFRLFINLVKCFFHQSLIKFLKFVINRRLRNPYEASYVAFASYPVISVTSLKRGGDSSTKQFFLNHPNNFSTFQMSTYQYGSLSAKFLLNISTFQMSTNRYGSHLGSCSIQVKVYLESP